MAETQVDEWRGLYGDGWKGTITDSAFSHPAKFAKGLIFKIIQHALDEGFVKPGDTTIDPFGGVGLGGLPCALQGIQHIAVELEPRFVALATGFDCGGDLAKHECCPVTEAEGLFGHAPHHVEGNLELWQRLYGTQPQWVQPKMVQGDSRELGKVLGAADCCVASPPFVDSDGRKGGSDLYYKNRVQTGRNPQAASAQHQTTTQPYGSSPHNLGNLSPGSVDACLSSPPHCHGLGKEHTYADHAKREKDSHRGIMREKGIADPFYGDNPAQLGNMPAGTLDACVASPPFSGTEQPCASQSRGLKDYHAFTRGKGTKRDATHTGETPGQLSAMATGEVEKCVESLKIEGFKLDSMQNPDRMLCSVHNKLSGDSVWQSVKTAEPVYHVDHAGACPVVVSTAANPFQPVQTAGNPLVEKPGDADTAELPRTVQCSEGKNIPLSIEQRSANQTKAGRSQNLTKHGSVKSNSSAQLKLPTIMPHGEGLDGEAYGKESSNETTINALNVDSQDDTWLSTTSRMPMQLRESGITVQTTSERYAENVTGNFMEQPCVSVLNAHNSSKEQTSSPLSVRQSAETYGEIDTNEREDLPETFWSASHKILRQVFDLLRPGGHAIWVVKSYVRDGKIVDFPGDWRRCAESVGFVTLHEHHALLVDSHSEMGLFGEEVEMYRRESKSFFRRLHQKRYPDLAIDFEVVFCMRKPMYYA